MLSTLIKKPARPAKNFYEVLLENSRNLVFVKDENFRIVYANQAFLNLYAPEFRPHVVGMISDKHFTDDEARVFLAEDRKAFESGFSEIVEEITDYKGHHFILQTQKIRFYDENGVVRILGLATDITRLVMRERALAKSNIALENFAALAAHDLRSPLAALSASLDIIRHDSDTQLGSKAQKHIHMMVSCVEGLIDQIGQLLATYKGEDVSEAGRVACDLSILFEEVRFNLSQKIAETNARVLSTELPRIKVHKTMFRQLLHNLVENALKYRSRETPIVILRYETKIGEHIFSVEDNGPGVLPELRDKIFGLYEQGDTKTEGYGIGLSLCQQIAEMHGGRIWLDPYYINGCKICFSIPMLAKT